MIRKIETQNELTEAQARLARAQARWTDPEAAEKEIDVETKAFEMEIAKIERVADFQTNKGPSREDGSLSNWPGNQKSARRRR